MSVFIPNEYKDEYENIKKDYKDVFSNNSDEWFVNTILSQNSLPDAFWNEKFECLGIKTLKGKKKIPYPIGVIIMYHKNKELIELYYKCMTKTNITDIISSKFKGYFEFKSKNIKEKYDDITEFYYKEYTERRNGSSQD